MIRKIKFEASYKKMIHDSNKYLNIKENRKFFF